jgi:hypothetical protein
LDHSVWLIVLAHLVILFGTHTQHKNHRSPIDLPSWKIYRTEVGMFVDLSPMGNNIELFCEYPVLIRMII